MAKEQATSVGRPWQTMIRDTKTTIINQNFSPVFGRYEAFRILIPGFYFALLLLCYYWSFLVRFVPESPSSAVLAVMVLGVTIVAGLTIYAKETPKRRRAFLENQPSQYLSAKARTMKDMPLLDDAEASRLYFYILNNYIPPIFHEKIFFFGMIYSIMIQVRRTSFWFGLAGMASLLVELSLRLSLAELQSLVVFTVVVWMIYVFNIRYNKADRKMQENYRDQIFWMEMNSPLIESILQKRQSLPRQS